jgi:hypothetical protein
MGYIIQWGSCDIRYGGSHPHVLINVWQVWWNMKILQFDYLVSDKIDHKILLCRRKFMLHIIEAL